MNPIKKAVKNFFGTVQKAKEINRDELHKAMQEGSDVHELLQQPGWKHVQDILDRKKEMLHQMALKAKQDNLEVFQFLASERTVLQIEEEIRGIIQAGREASQKYK